MKFMKLGSRPDTFYTTEAVRSVSSEVSSDLIIQVKGSRYLLHKFPLLSKCARLQKLCSENPETSHIQMIQLHDFPCGVEAFELCAKFCYGITITLSAYNIVSIRCASEYLQMSEHVERGNLIQKLEAFFASCILQGWKDTIVTLQSTKSFPMWSEDLKITSRCVEAIASKVSAHPAKVDLSRSYSRNGSESHRLRNNKVKPTSSSTKGWWAEDLADLGIGLYWRTMIAIKSNGIVRSDLIGDALRIYASRWLPNVSKYMNNEESDYDDDDGGEVDNGQTTSKHRLLLESIVSLLPAEKGSVSCSFLLKLLKASNILRSSSSTKTELARRVGLQLEEANVNDLLIPNCGSNPRMAYDVDVVTTILEQFMSQSQSPPTSPVRVKGDDYCERRRSRSAENLDFEFQESRRSSSASHSSKLKVAKLMDRYLQEIAKDENLPLSKFIAIAERIPEFARPDHDDLYKAIDTYLKVHTELNKSERKALCRALDCKKLSVEACMHAAQNEKLPLRVVVQVLFFEQARSATVNGGKVAELPGNIRALLVASHKNQAKAKAGSLSTSTSVAREDQSPKSNVSTLKMKLAENDDLDEEFKDGVRTASNRSKPLLSGVPKRVFGKLWPINRSVSDKN